MVQVWAHRGASTMAPENTIPAFTAAIESGATGIELDVHLSSDGQVVVIHDETLNRTAGIAGTVAEMTSSQLSQVIAQAGFSGFPDAHIPTLDEVLDVAAASGVHVNIELKGQQPDLPRVVLERVRGWQLDDAVLYSSFNHYHLQALADLGTTSRRGVLLAQPLFEPWEYASRLLVDAVHPPMEMLAIPGLVEHCHEHGLAVNVWTPDSPREWHHAVSLGVDSVITNRPQEAVAALAAS